MKILYVSANPEWVKNPQEPTLDESPPDNDFSEYTKLDLWPELREITNALFDDRMSGSVRLEVVPEANAGDVIRYVDKFQPDIVHFSGHGEKERLVVADPEYFDGETASAQWLKSALTDKGVDVLVLNCCWSSTFLDVLEPSVGMVVGAETRLSSELAQEFSKRFYTCLRDGLTVGEAYTQAAKVSQQYKAAPQAGDALAMKLQRETAPDEFTEALNGYEGELKDLEANLWPDLKWDMMKIAGGLFVAGFSFFVLSADAESTLGLLIPSETLAKHKDWLSKEPFALFLILIREPLARIWSYSSAKAAIGDGLENLSFARLSEDLSGRHRFKRRAELVIGWLKERDRNE